MKEKALATARKLKEMGITLDDIIMMFEEIDKEDFKNEESKISRNNIWGYFIYSINCWFYLCMGIMAKR